MGKLREFLKGKKAYITAAIGLLGAVVAWADGQIDTLALPAGVWAAAQACFIRAGIGNEVKRSRERPSV
ncbi:MAG: hypothetical protein ISS78_02535 [Phycisphaerae bacterium]|nr:hypothetical protein [Phycisphaerae bacterium]